MRPTIAESDWREIRYHYANGIDLREIARSMEIPVETILAQAQREGWTCCYPKSFQSIDDKARYDWNLIIVKQVVFGNGLIPDAFVIPLGGRDFATLK